MNRRYRFQRMAMAQRAAEVNRMVAEYERELLRERNRSKREAEDRAAPPPRKRTTRRTSPQGMRRRRQEPPLEIPLLTASA
jgi:hypothetical protein